MPFRRLTYAIILLTIGSSSAGAQKNVDDYITQKMRELQIPGLSLAVVKNGKVVKERGYGLADVELNSPATPQTVYKIASLSKQFIAAAVLLLVQDGKIRLDDRAVQFLDGAPDAWSAITVRELLTHTSGIARDPANYDAYRDQPITDVIKSAYAMPLVFQPGEKWLYSNVGYYVLAAIITKVSRMPWDHFIATRLFSPAGMTSTRTTTASAIVQNRAKGYTRDGNTIVNADDWIAVRPSGAFLSTVVDLAKWDDYLDSTRILADSSRAQMWTRAKLKDQTLADYGFGWYLNSFFGRARIHHDGQYPGFRADYERFPDEKLTVIVLANFDQAGLESLALNVAGFYSDALAIPPFALFAESPTVTGASGHPVPIRFTARDNGKAAPGSVLEIEVWDASDKSVYKEHKSNEDFAAGEAKSYAFTWTPASPGIYTVTLGVYGPGWTPSYLFAPKAEVITVR